MCVCRPGRTMRSRFVLPRRLAPSGVARSLSAGARRSPPPSRLPGDQYRSSVVDLPRLRRGLFVSRHARAPPVAFPALALRPFLRRRAQHKRRESVRGSALRRRSKKSAAHVGHRAPGAVCGLLCARGARRSAPFNSSAPPDGRRLRTRLDARQGLVDVAERTAPRSAGTAVSPSSPNPEGHHGEPGSRKR